jgi:hypothetical protein
MQQDGDKTTPVSPKAQPKTEVNGKAFKVVAVVFVTIVVLGFFALTFLLGKLYPS